MAPRPVHAEPFARGTALTAPFTVRDYVAKQKSDCLLIGGEPAERPGFVTLVDLTDDGLVDYVVDLGELDCLDMWPPWRGAHGWWIGIFVARPDGTAIKAFEGMTDQVTIERELGLARVFLGVGGTYCGQDTAGVPFSGMRSCRRPLNWNGQTNAFEFAPLAEARPRIR